VGNGTRTLCVRQPSGLVLAFDQGDVPVVEQLEVLFAELPADEFVIGQGVAHATIQQHHFVMLFQADRADVVAHSNG
jgi:hypothetical protein